MEKSKDIIAALLSGSMFLLFLFILKINLIVAMFATILMFIGLNVIFLDKQCRYKTLEQQIVKETDNAASRDGFNNSRLRICEVNNHIKELSGQVKNKVERISSISEKILENTVRNFSNKNEVKKIFSYYLNSLNKILCMYRELSEQKVETEEIDIVLNEVETILDQVIVVFEKYQERSLQSKVFILETEIQLLKETMNLEA